ncbi:hypothetical protein NDU88_007344 [Pleurodeles waltl]|uniref:Uncharacterized protein n=1 Tax=Pleurodeles waltl TaxID=8319 RepID=A0AAV7PR54_PLEWA|nr:hypothetical protein NDU88_007344 [Pleurodeles waltl]
MKRTKSSLHSDLPVEPAQCARYKNLPSLMVNAAGYERKSHASRSIKTTWYSRGTCGGTRQYYKARKRRVAASPQTWHSIKQLGTAEVPAVAQGNTTRFADSERDPTRVAAPQHVLMDPERTAGVAFYLDFPFKHPYPFIKTANSPRNWECCVLT